MVKRGGIKAFFHLLWVGLGVFLCGGCQSSAPKNTTEPTVKDNIKKKTSPIKVSWIFDSTFTTTEKNHTKEWLLPTLKTTNQVLGVYPFTVFLKLQKYPNSTEPIPWAHTVKNTVQGVKFYINPTFEVQDFLNDWTAAHELSHLSIPFVGKSNAWFSEGYASFMQEQIRIKMGVKSSTEVQGYYLHKFQQFRPYFTDSSSLALRTMSLRQEYNFPAMYWGGALFFWHLDQQLQHTQNMRLTELIKRYQKNRDAGINYLPPKELVRLWDKELRHPICDSLFKEVNQKPAKWWFDALPK